MVGIGGARWGRWIVQRGYGLGNRCLERGVVFIPRGFFLFFVFFRLGFFNS